MRVPKYLLLAFATGMAISAAALVHIVAHYLDLRLTVAGEVNLTVICLILFWYFLDTFFRRRELYEFFGLQEMQLVPWLRMVRMLVLVVLTLSAVYSAIDARLCHLVDVGYADKGEAELHLSRSMVLLSGMGLAALGWLYTNHQKVKSDQINNTLTALRDQTYDFNNSLDYRRLVKLTGCIRKEHKIGKDDVFPIEAFDIKLSRYTSDEVNDNVTFGQLVDRLMNKLNQLAMGVRMGQFDFTSVELVLRARYVSYAHEFSRYIAQETIADIYLPSGLERIWYRKHIGRKVATTRTWEHFLWICWRLPVFRADNIDKSVFVIPPKYRQGKSTSVNY